jgi:hypothetical protein
MSLLIPGTNSIKDTGYDVANSARFDAGNTEYIQRTYGTPTNAKIFGLSWWIKMSGDPVSGTGQFDLWGERTNSSNRVFMGIDGVGQFDFFEKNGGSNVLELETSRLFRDNSAWYHFLLLGDSTQGTASNRIKLYVNGVQETSFVTETYPSQDYEFRLALNSTKYFGRIGLGSQLSNNYFDGYLAEVAFVDGTVTAHTDYGEFDEDSPTIWKPKDISGLNFGNNGFHLDFEDSSALGNDVSGNDNDFTVNNLTSVDQSTDTCTNNFATLNPLVTYPAAPPVHSEGNLQVVTVNADPGYFGSSSTIGVTQGKWYAEFKPTNSTGGLPYEIGVSIDPAEFARNGATATYAYDSNIWGYYANGGTVYHGGSSSSYGDSYTTNDIIGVFLDLDNHKLYFSVNGQIQNSGTGISLTTGKTYYFIVSDLGGGVTTYQANFGGPPFSITSSKTDANGYGNFEYSPNDDGGSSFDGAAKNFYALNTKNLAEFG